MQIDFGIDNIIFVLVLICVIVIAVGPILLFQQSIDNNNATATKATVGRDQQSLLQVQNKNLTTVNTQLVTLRITTEGSDSPIETTSYSIVSSLTHIFKQVENSVVQITNKLSKNDADTIINGGPLESQSIRLGSGFVYDREGHIVTNNHVVDGSKTVDVTFVDGNTYTANVIGNDPYSDISVLQITDNDFLYASGENSTSAPLVIGNSS